MGFKARMNVTRYTQPFTEDSNLRSIHRPVMLRFEKITEGGKVGDGI